MDAGRVAQPITAWQCHVAGVARHAIRRVLRARSQRGSYAALEAAWEPVALTNLHAPAAPWDDAILGLMVAAEHEDASSAGSAAKRVFS